MSRKFRQLAAPAVALAGAAASAAWFRRYYLRWGATDAETGGALPGDDVLPNPDLLATRAVTVRAPAGAVWPWLAQIGQGRGGFYSYDFLENLLGLDIHSTDRIHQEWQDIQAGDHVHLAPAASSDLEVVRVDTGSALVLRVPPDSPPGPFDFTWAFVLRPQPDGSTRLLVRERYAYRRWWTVWTVEAVEVASFIMSRRMLQGIRTGAERHP
ncbi:MAG: SRPBCC family protein [Arthrobacter sp.]